MNLLSAFAGVAGIKENNGEKTDILIPTIVLGLFIVGFAFLVYKMSR